jgi:hypothetical protein
MKGAIVTLAVAAALGGTVAASHAQEKPATPPAGVQKEMLPAAKVVQTPGPSMANVSASGFAQPDTTTYVKAQKAPQR